MNIKIRTILIKIIYKIIKKICSLFGLSFSFSSDGEDYILTKLFLGLEQGRYIDIGSNYPIKHSNTFSLYLLGWTGICVDPILFLKKKYKLLRPEDNFINAGIRKKSDLSLNLDFYFYKKQPDNSTFDISRVEELKKLFNRHPSSVIQVPTISVDQVMLKFNGKFPKKNDVHFLNLDIEGGELDILKDFINLDVYPWVICVEELGHTTQTVFNTDIYNLLKKNYHFFSKTFLSSIYVRKDIINKLPSDYVKELKF